MMMVSPLGPHPQQSAYSGVLNISKVLVRKPGTDVIIKKFFLVGKNRVEREDKTWNNLEH